MKKILAFLSIIFLAQTAFAQAVPALLIPSDTRSLSMGGVALLPDFNTMDAQLFYSMWSPKYASNTIIGTTDYFRFNDRFCVSVEGRFFSDQPYHTTSAQGIPDGYQFTPSEKIFGAGLSVGITDALSASVKGRYVSSAIAEDAKGSAICGDLALTYTLGSYSATLGVRNLGSKISYGGASYSLPALAALQGSLKPVKGLTIGVEADYIFAGSLMAAAGAEYTLLDILSLRAGYHYGNGDAALASFASVGLGVKIKGVHLDATYLAGSKTLAGTMMFAVGYSF